MPKKRKTLYIAVLLLVFLVFSATTVWAADMGNFVPQKNYTEDLFSDIVPTDWFYEDIISAYEFGLINGMGEGVFMPNEHISVASVLALACRVHACYYGVTAPQNGAESWFTPYVEYAITSGIIMPENFVGHYEDAVTRAEVAYILSRILPVEIMPVKNAVAYLPDVDKSHRYYEEILYFYNRGICVGRDECHDFFPDKSIARSEVMVILHRLLSAEKRLSVTVAMPQTHDEILAETLRLVNLYRADIGLQLLMGSTVINEAAQVRATEIATRREHIRPNGSEFYTVMTQFNMSFHGAGENIACGQSTPIEVMSAWMNSLPHRSNILNPDFTTLGIGCYSTSFGMICWEQLFMHN